MSAERDPDSIYDIIDSIKIVMTYTTGMTYSQFLADTRTLDAVTRRIEIIGQATKRLSMELRDKYPDIEWRKMTGTRDRLAHNYDKVDIEVIWAIARKFGPESLPRLQQILTEIGDINE